MTASAYVDPLGRPKLTVGEVAALQEELASERITPEQREKIRTKLELAHAREGVAFDGREPHNRLVFKMCEEVLKEDYLRQQAIRQEAEDKRKAAAREERRVLVAGRPDRFAALPGHVQATMYAESQATDARAGWKAYGEALALQAAGKPIPVPWSFETEMLTGGEIAQLARQGFVSYEFADEAARRALREAM